MSTTARGVARTYVYWLDGRPLVDSELQGLPSPKGFTDLPFLVPQNCSTVYMYHDINSTVPEKCIGTNSFTLIRREKRIPWDTNFGR